MHRTCTLRARTCTRLWRTRSTWPACATARSYTIVPSYLHGEPLTATCALDETAQWRVQSFLPLTECCSSQCIRSFHSELAGACTTSGMAWKLHGRVGDS